MDIHTQLHILIPMAILMLMIDMKKEKKTTIKDKKTVIKRKKTAIKDKKIMGQVLIEIEEEEDKIEIIKKEAVVIKKLFKNQ